MAVHLQLDDEVTGVELVDQIHTQHGAEVIALHDAKIVTAQVAELIARSSDQLEQPVDMGTQTRSASLPSPPPIVARYDNVSSSRVSS